MSIYFDVTVTLRNSLNTGIQRVVKDFAKEIKENQMKVIAGDYKKTDELVILDNGDLEVFLRKTSNYKPKSLVNIFFWFVQRARPVLRFIGSFKFGMYLKNQILVFFMPNYSLFRKMQTNSRARLAEKDTYITFDAFWNTEQDYERIVSAKSSKSQIVIFVHDLIPFNHPEWFDKSNIKNFAKYFVSGVELADVILFSSLTVQKNFSYHFPNNVAHKKVITLGSRQILLDKATEPSPSLGYIVMLGTLEPRKNYEEVLEWYAEFDMPQKLVIVGRDGWKSKPIKKRIRQLQKKGKNVVWHNGATDQELQEILRNACVGICASLEEGYGLPLREFIRMGIPVVASDIGAFREEKDPGVIFYSLGDLDSLHKAVISQILTPIYPTMENMLDWEATYKTVLGILGKNESEL